jgi:cation:H+ antiporter
MFSLGLLTYRPARDVWRASAVGTGERFGISNPVIGPTVIALSTSAHEFLTTLVAAVKRQADVVVGNVIGSNVLNSLGIMGASSLASLRGLTVPAHVMAVDIPLMLAGAECRPSSPCGRCRSAKGWAEPCSASI